MDYDILIISIVILYLLFILLSIYTVLSNIKSQSRAISWIFAILFIPFGGIFFYYVLGKKKRRDEFILGKSPFLNKEEKLFIPEYLATKTQLLTLLNKNDSSALSYNNKVKIFQESQTTFESIYNCVKKAKVSIHMEFYIVQDGLILDHLIDLFTQKTKQGVNIKLLVDGYGSYDLSMKSKNKLKEIKVELKEFMPFPFFKLLKYANNRNHRKSIIIDNRIAFTGGYNLMNSYLNPDPAFGLRKDTFVQIEGAAAADINRVFLADWHYSGGEQLDLPSPALNDLSNTNIPIHITSSSPISRYQSIMQIYFTLITDAEEYIYIVTPYFSPNSSIMTALKTTALSGVNVEIMLPYNSDSKWAQHCMFSYIEELLDAGIKVFLYRNGFLHSKIIICDDIISSVGSANFDERSLNANFEINALIYNKEISLELKNKFILDKVHCEELTIESFTIKAGRSKILESFARLSSPLL